MAVVGVCCEPVSLTFPVTGKSTRNIHISTGNPGLNQAASYSFPSPQEPDLKLLTGNYRSTIHCITTACYGVVVSQNKSQVGRTMMNRGILGTFMPRAN
jgi:hypothetical protein